MVLLRFQVGQSLCIRNPKTCITRIKGRQWLLASFEGEHLEQAQTTQNLSPPRTRP